MKLLALAFLFAIVLASATQIGLHQQVLAQHEAIIVVRKVVEGLSPASDWTFDMQFDGPSYSTIIIDKAGGERTITVDTLAAVTIIENTKPNYVVYASHAGSTVQTHIVVVGVQELNEEHSVTIAFINQNAFTPSAEPVGGVIEPVSKLSVLAQYMVVFGLVAAVAVVVWKKREN